MPVIKYIFFVVFINLHSNNSETISQLVVPTEVKVYLINGRAVTVNGLTYSASFATFSLGAIGLPSKTTSHIVTTGIHHRALLLAAAVTVFSVVHDPVAAGSELSDLIWLVQQAEGVALAHPVLELVRGAGAKLIGLDPLVSDDGGPHYAAVPVLTTAATSAHGTS